MLAWTGLLFLIMAAFPNSSCWAGKVSPLPSPSSVAPPVIESLLKPEIYQRVMKSRDIMAHASLQKTEGSLKKYSFYAAMLTRAGLSRTREILTDYEIYSKLIPYIDEAKYQPTTRLLDLKGGIWMWKLSSVLRFDERGDRWIRFEVVGGHFTGLMGDIFFEPQGEKGTLVYIQGSQQGMIWPPAFILEQGAQIVFEFTAQRMRSYLESPSEKLQDKNRSGRSHDPSPDKFKVPEPRSHL